MIRTPTSLRWRLLLLSTLVMIPALLWLAWQLSWEFEDSVESRVHQELENHMKQLLARLQPAPDGTVRITGPLSDPRFNTPLSGLYWQINDAEGKVLHRSRSLWDAELTLTPTMLRQDGIHEYVLTGPRNETLYALVRGVWVELPASDGNGATNSSAATERRTEQPSSPPGSNANGHRYIITVALDHAEISAALRQFNWQLTFGLLLLAAILIATILAQVIWGLRPLDVLRKQLQQVRQGSTRTLQNPGVAELEPLVQELNTLLATHEQQVENARARAANLAHGMKTPLAVLAAVAREVRKHGLDTQAHEMEEQLHQLRRHVEHELARSKIHGGMATIPHTRAARALQGIIRALHATAENLHWRVDVPEDAIVPMEEGDFMELAGNLLENASKWAHSTVRVRLDTNTRGLLHLRVEDDGPGVAPQHYDTIMQRGTRLDESTHGNGLGLAIVRDILDSYGYSLRFYRADLGGLGVEVMFHRADSASLGDATRN